MLLRSVTLTVCAMSVSLIGCQPDPEVPLTNAPHAAPTAGDHDHPHAHDDHSHGDHSHDQSSHDEDAGGTG